jgi:hypothetical protein
MTAEFCTKELVSLGTYWIVILEFVRMQMWPFISFPILYLISDCS